MELSKRDQLPALVSRFLEQTGQAGLWWLPGVLLLLPLNWLIEAFKWHYFIRRYEPVSLMRAYAAVLVGVTFSLLTPNRIGEFGGRLLYVRRINHWRSIASNAVGGVAQYLVLLAGGIVGAIYLAPNLWPGLPEVERILAGAVVVVAVLYVFYFNPLFVLPVLKRLTQVKWLGFIKPAIEMLEGLRPRDMAVIWLWSALRCLVYVTQYYLMLRFFGIEIGVSSAFSGIFLIFMLQTILPVPALAGLLLRGNLAVWLWSHFGAAEISSLAATFSLWIINLILPALVGTFLMLNVNISKTLGYEQE